MNASFIIHICILTPYTWFMYTFHFCYLAYTHRVLYRKWRIFVLLYLFDTRQISFEMITGTWTFDACLQIAHGKITSTYIFVLETLIGFPIIVPSFQFYIRWHMVFLCHAGLRLLIKKKPLTWIQIVSLISSFLSVVSKMNHFDRSPNFTGTRFLILFCFHLTCCEK